MMFEKDYLVRGKHAHQIKFLNAYQRRIEPDKYGKNAGFFPAAIDIYVVAPLIGVAYNRTAPIHSESPETNNIHSDAIIRRQRDLDTVYRVVMLTEQQNDLSDDDRVIRAFRDDEDEEKLTKILELFHSYMRGGLEWLFEQATDGATTQEDYLKKIVEIVNLYCDDNGLQELSDELFN